MSTPRRKIQIKAVVRGRGADRRRAIRYAARWPVTLICKEGSFPGTTEVVSTTGLLLYTGRAFATGETVEIEAIPHRAHEFRCRIEVVRVQRQPDGRYCVGARFEEISEEERNLLRKALQFFSHGWADPATLLRLAPVECP